MSTKKTEKIDLEKVTRESIVSLTKKLNHKATVRDTVFVLTAIAAWMTMDIAQRYVGDFAELRRYIVSNYYKAASRENYKKFRELAAMAAEMEGKNDETKK